MPIISVIVPIFKTEQYLEACLASIRAQTLTDIEILCVNDCSPDDSVSIVRRHAAQDPRIVLIEHEKNLGLGGARNTGILAAKADFIASVDSDDTIAPHMLETLWEASENGTFDIVNCAFDRVDPTGKLISSQVPKACVLDNSDGVLDIFKHVPPAFWNKLWRKSLFTNNDIFFPEHVFYQDSATTPRILAVTNKIKCIQDRLYFYLLRADSATFTYDAKHIIDYLKVFDVLRDFLIERGLYERHEAGFRDFINRGIRFHSSNVAEADAPPEQKLQYLRHLMLVKLAYLEHRASLDGLSQETLLEYLSSAQGRRDLAGPDTAEKLDISVVIKTFLRPEILNRILASIAEFEDVQGVRFAEVLVGDDSPKDILHKNHDVVRQIKHIYPRLNVIYEQYEENIGLSDGRNRLVKKATARTILLCDDDFIFDADADLRGALEIVTSEQYALVGGWLKNHYNPETGAWTYWGTFGTMSESDSELVITLNETQDDVAEIEPSDYILNFFLADRQVLLDNPWDEKLKVEEHQEFFLRLWRGPHKACLYQGLFVKHTADRRENGARYNSYRFGKENWEHYLFAALETMGKSRRTINRWRNGKFVQWVVDATERTSVERSVPLHDALLSPQVPVTRITPKHQQHSFGYFDVPAVSADGRWAVVQTVPAFDRLPVASDLCDIKLIDLNGDQTPRKVAQTSAWCHQQGAQLQFLGGAKDTLIYNVFDAEDQVFKTEILNFETGKNRRLPKPVAAISADGRKMASVNYARLFDYRPGYGYPHVKDPFASQNMPEDDGLFMTDVETGKVRLVLSYEDIVNTLLPDPSSVFRTQKWLINHVGFNPSGTKVVMLVRTFSNDPPFPTFTLVCNVDGSDLRKVFGFCSHYHWKDDRILLGSGAPGFKRSECRTIKVYEIDTETRDHHIIGDGILNNDGHCSYSPDRSMMLYDSYASKDFPYRLLQVFEFETGRCINLGYFYAPHDLYADNADLRCDLHPRWSSDGTRITFDSIHEGYRAVYSIYVADVKAALARFQLGFSTDDLKIWYKGKYAAASGLPAEASSGARKAGMNGTHLGGRARAVLGLCWPILKPHLNDRERQQYNDDPKTLFGNARHPIMIAVGRIGGLRA